MHQVKCAKENILNYIKWIILNDKCPEKRLKKITQLKAWTYGKKKEYTMEKVYQMITTEGSFQKQYHLKWYQQYPEMKDCFLRISNTTVNLFHFSFSPAQSTLFLPSSLLPEELCRRTRVNKSKQNGNCCEWSRNIRLTLKTR